MAVDEGQSKEGGRWNAAMDLVRDPQEARDRQRRDRQDNQLHRRLEADELAQWNDQQVDAEIADRRPVIVVITRKPFRVRKIDCDAVAAHVAEQVH